MIMLLNIHFDEMHIILQITLIRNYLVNLIEHVLLAHLHFVQIILHFFEFTMHVLKVIVDSTYISQDQILSLSQV